jgi:hypothetical protein
MRVLIMNDAGLRKAFPPICAPRSWSMFLPVVARLCFSESFHDLAVIGLGCQSRAGVDSRLRFRRFMLVLTARTD